MNIKEARLQARLTQKEFSEMFEIPLDTVKNWDAGRRNPPVWAEKLLLEKLEKIIEERKTMKIYEIKKFTSEINGEENVEVGCALGCSEPESIKKFDNLEEAKAELEKMPNPTAEYMPSVVPYFDVTEYAIEVYEVDKDGDFVSGSDFYTQEKEMEIKSRDM